MSFRQIFLLILVGLTILMVLSVSGGDRHRDLVDIGSNEEFIWSSLSRMTEYLERYQNSDRSGKSSVPAVGRTYIRQRRQTGSAACSARLRQR